MLPTIHTEKLDYISVSEKDSEAVSYSESEFASDDVCPES
jgi:hypothetical protein